MKKWPTELGQPDREYITGRRCLLSFTRKITADECKIVRTFLFELAEDEKITFYYKEIDRTLECTLSSADIDVWKDHVDPGYRLSLTIVWEKSND